MTISDELVMALLSMDSYRRGYNAGISDGVNVVGNTDTDGLGEVGFVGNAEIYPRSEIGISDAQFKAWEAAGFYAVAYKIMDENGNAKIVISYRATDSVGELLTTDPTITFFGDEQDPSIELARDFDNQSSNKTQRGDGRRLLAPRPPYILHRLLAGAQGEPPSIQILDHVLGLGCRHAAQFHLVAA